MRINSINAFNTNPLNFGGEKKNSNGMKKAAQAMILATALSGAAGCDKLSNNVHNHYFELPTDSFTKTELKPTPVPPQIIIVEKEVPGKTDTVIQPGKPDTVFVEIPGKTDTIIQPGKPDTIFIEIPGKTDTIIQPGKPDTVFIEKPPIVVHDTLQLPPDTLYIKDEWKSPVPPKQEEIYDHLGIETTGNGKFFLSTAYYDNKNNELVNRHLHGQSSSRDGKILVYNVVKTKWDDAAEGVVLGKNESFEKHLVYLSEDGQELGMKILKPKVDIKVSNGDEKSNWQVFEKGTLSTPDAWQDETSFFMSRNGAVIDLSNDFNLKRGHTDQSVTVTNPYNSEWDLIDWNIVKGDPD